MIKDHEVPFRQWTFVREKEDFSSICVQIKSIETGNRAYTIEIAEELLNHMNDRLHSFLLPIGQGETLLA